MVVICVPLITAAQSEVNSSKITIPNPIQNTAGNSLLGLLNLILEKIVMPIAVVAVVMYIIYAGFTFVTAQGNPVKITAAKQRLLWALVGAGVLLGATAISKVVENTVKGLIQ